MPLTVPAQHAIGDAGHTTDHDTTYSILGLVFQDYQFYVADPAYGAKGDGKTVVDGAMGSGSTTLTSASAVFTAGDVGKAVMVTKADAAGIPLSTTISAFTNSTTVTLTSGNASGGAVSSCIVTWGTDDTTAIRNAVNAAVTFAQANNFYAEVLFDAEVHIIAGAPVQGGATLGNAQIPLPVIVASGGLRKVTLAFKGAGDASGLPHWQQTQPQQAGTVLACVRADGTNNGTFDAASVLGGPTPLQGYGTTGAIYSNMLVVIDGITISVPYNSTYCGFDFRGVAEANVVTASVMARDWPAGPMGTVTNITNQWTWGLCMPLSGNNDNCNVLWYSCEGLCYGFMPSEHTAWHSVRCVYCITGVEATSGVVAMPHAGQGFYTSVEHSSNGLGFFDSLIRLSIANLDGESLTTFIFDPSNKGVGEIHITGQTGGSNNVFNQAGTVNGGAGLHVIDDEWSSGVPGAQPAVPASTTALINGYWRDAAVTVVGGTTTAVAVAGTALGLTTTPYHSLIVPAGETIAITYSVAPTWKWVIM